MSENRAKALELAVRSQPQDFPDGILATARKYLAFLDGEETGYTYWKYENQNIWYRAANTDSVTFLERATTSTFGKWETNFSPANPQCVEDIERNPGYRKVSPGSIPASLRANG